ncbi:hypothetical protein HPB51_017550 [Rhipicephalus microplus]|uniref:Uncharacterized protein n=1 Tax=Rhipicephalus microplus TaxID=6941 RepID=A0A9J6EB22_RHIMP|nr:uncharacterized protein LOC119164355 [Rhipicephalus microplus]KAH8031487.1 hypothetical protein HPB51_017550 [Rhipicephalus microplus]
MSLKRIFPFSEDDVKSRACLDSTETFVLGDDQSILDSLALQLAVTSAGASEYVAIVGCNAIETAFHVHDMPLFSQDMVDFIRPRFMADLKSLFSYLTKFQQLPVYPNVIILHGIETYIQQASEDENGDQTIAVLFALVRDATSFATSKNHQTCRLLVTCCDAASEGHVCPSYVSLPFFPLPWRCSKLENGGFTLRLGGRLPTTVRFSLSKRELCLQRVDYF